MAQDNNKSVYTRQSSATGWFVSIVVALALLSIGYLVFEANNAKTQSAATTQSTTK